MGKILKIIKKFVVFMGIGYFSTHALVASSQNLKPITVAAAANLNGTLEQLILQYQSQAKQEIRVVYGSSGNFYQQITQGGPFDIFLSANADFADRLEKEGFSNGPSKVYAKGRLVLWISGNLKINLEPSLKDFQLALTDGRVRQFAIANPKLAPYGLAAEQSLKKYGVYDLVQSKIVLGGDVGQTALFLSSGAASAGMIPFSLVNRSNELKVGKSIIVPEEYHEPIVQKMILLKKAAPDAVPFYNFITSDIAKKIWHDNGYD